MLIYEKSFNSSLKLCLSNPEDLIMPIINFQTENYHVDKS